MAFISQKLMLRGWGRRSGDIPGRASAPNATPDPAPVSADAAVVEAVDPPAAVPDASPARPTRSARSARSARSTGSRRRNTSMAAATTDATDSATTPAPTAPRATVGRPLGTELETLDATPFGEARPIRVLLVEELDEVVAHTREMLRSQSTTRLVGVVRDGGRVLDEIRELRPDVVIVDALLQGRVKGKTLARRIAEAKLPVGVVALTVADEPIDPARTRGVDAVVSLPFGTYDLGRAIGGAMEAVGRRDPSRSHRVVAVFGAKGGVGKTTVAYNLASAFASEGLATALLDGSLQYGDVRHLVRAAPDLPSICDLPADCVRGSDLVETVVRDPSGVDLLLAPPRPEMAELVGPRDLEALVDLLRRAYQAIVIDTTSALTEPTLALLDSADVILQLVTPETGAVEATRTALDTFDALGYPPSKVRVVINRADSHGGLGPREIARALGRDAVAELPSDWPLVSASNAEGVPFIHGRTGAPLSQAIEALAAQLGAVVGSRPAPAPTGRRRR
jgi:pilus assembly protein CpaE